MIGNLPIGPGSVVQGGSSPNLTGTNPAVKTTPAGTLFGVMPTQPRPQNSVAQIMSQLHPQAQQALRSIPQGILQHLQQAGLVHPGLVGHLYGGAR